jgi:hypothetical protein
MANNNSTRRGKRRVESHCNKRAKSQLNMLLKVRKSTKRNNMTKLAKKDFVQGSTKSCIGMYKNKDGKMIPMCEKHISRVIKLNKNIRSTVKMQKLTKKELNALTKSAKEGCEEEYPTL